MRYLYFSYLGRSRAFSSIYCSFNLEPFIRVQDLDSAIEVGTQDKNTKWSAPGRTC